MRRRGDRVRRKSNLIWSWKEREQLRRIRPSVTDGSRELLAGEIFVANHATIIAKYLIIFKPLMESFTTGRRARLCGGFSLEMLQQL